MKAAFADARFARPTRHASYRRCRVVVGVPRVFAAARPGAKFFDPSRGPRVGRSRVKEGLLREAQVRAGWRRSAHGPLFRLPPFLAPAGPRATCPPPPPRSARCGKLGNAAARLPYRTGAARPRL